MEVVQQIVDSMNGITSYFLVFSLVAVGLYLTFRSNFVQIRMFPEMFRAVTEKKERKGEVSAFQAFCISAASRVGAANISGVAIAITTGGPGAIFWMWVIATIGMATGFVESMLAQVYKERRDGQFRGGPAYYIEKALGKRWLGVIFALLIAVTFGFIFNSLQANTIAIAMDEAFGLNRLTVGIVIALAVGVIIFGGIRSISVFSGIVVPIMAVAYIGVVFFVVVSNYQEIPHMFALIIGHAFGLKEATVGIFAGLLVGAQRGLFSNEAGMGSVPNAAATADVSHPVKQGLVQSLGVFFDTIIICSATAFVILLTDVYQTAGDGVDGVALTQASLSEFVGSWAVPFIAIAIFFFSFTSIVGNYYYGETNLAFIKEGIIWLQVYRLLVVAMVVFGSLAAIELVWSLADVFMAFTTVVNLMAILLIGGISFAVISDYQSQRQQGKNPVFKSKNIPGLKNASTWDD
ncbi:alanine/glycine:cation symporter family protein [Shouchella clausii]|uniref:alanine/glycine:cation symporter family protein n=1 Tax=Shouchella clausii TaxID=79880 RepID=UPI000BA658E9|nr:alanine/glycine:cation symporter family protein [Shouchella clausii]MCY1104967.1 alanine/glycine:cation symporter family protein [Shouchella clausii]PAD12439.1 sodium:alanine symporter family protein [Shouchella clausii]PTL23270.1 alanine:cation symporter family protein [Shouchella clausii]